MPYTQTSFADRLADFLLGLSGLSGQAGDYFRQGELDDEKRRKGRFDVLESLGRLDVQRGQLTSLEEDRQEKRRLAQQKMLEDQRQVAEKERIGGLRRGAFGKLLAGKGDLSTLTPDELAEGLGDLKSDSPIARFLLPQTKEPEPFTLSPGQRRYGGAGSVLAEVPAKPEKAASLGTEITAALAELGIAPDDATSADVAKARRLIQQGRVDVSSAQGREAARAPYQPFGGGTPDATPTAPTAPPQRDAPPDPQPTESPAQYKVRLEAWADQRQPTAAEKNRVMSASTMEVILDRLEGYIDEGAFKGVGKGFLGRLGGAATQGVAAARQSNQALVRYKSLMEGVLAQPVRFMGDVGTLNEGDMKRARALFGQPTATGGWIPSLPDTEETARNLIDQFRDLIHEIKSRPENRARWGVSPRTAPGVPPGLHK